MGASPSRYDRTRIFQMFHVPFHIIPGSVPMLVRSGPLGTPMPFMVMHPEQPATGISAGPDCSFRPCLQLPPVLAWAANRWCLLGDPVRNETRFSASSAVRPTSHRSRRFNTPGIHQDCLRYPAVYALRLGHVRGEVGTIARNGVTPDAIILLPGQFASSTSLVISGPRPRSASSCRT